MPNVMAALPNISGAFCENFWWMSMDGQGTKYRRKIAENYNRLSRVKR